MNMKFPTLTGDWLSCRQTKALFAMFEKAGWSARFVGGVVRNALLQEPVHDLDVATNARPETVMELARSAGFKAVGTGLKHGTVTIIIDHHVYEITTLRVDVESHGRHATVAFTEDWHADAARRDFTMNALYADGDGTLFDPLEGYGDLAARRVRFIGKAEDRINEDYLRILRFFRFSAQYGNGDLDQDGLMACVRLERGLAQLSRERVGSEFFRLLQTPLSGSVLKIMYSHGLLGALLGLVPHLTRYEAWCALETELEISPDPVSRLGALYVLKKEDAGYLGDHLRLSKEQVFRLGRWAATNEDGIELTATMSEHQAREACYRRGPLFQDDVAINWLRSSASPDDPRWRALFELPERWQVPEFPLKGRDLMDKGMAPGLAVGQKLKLLEAMWIDSDFTLSNHDLLEQISGQKS